MKYHPCLVYKSLCVSVFIKITAQRDDFVNHDYPFSCHIHFDNDNFKITDCKISHKNYLFIIEGTTQTGQEIQLFWGEQHFQFLKNIAPCTKTITEFETLKQQINTDKCVDINELHTVFLVVCKKEAIELLDDKLKV